MLSVKGYPSHLLHRSSQLKKSYKTHTVTSFFLNGYEFNPALYESFSALLR